MDLIERQAALDALANYIHNVDKVYSTGKLSEDDCKDAAHSVLDDLPSVQLEKTYTKADYLINLHKQYGCTFERAEKAHQKALEYLQSEAMMKG